MVECDVSLNVISLQVEEEVVKQNLEKVFQLNGLNKGRRIFDGILQGIESCWKIQ